jgi:hypothetical protein
MTSVSRFMNRLEATITKRSAAIMEEKAISLKETFLNVLREWKSEVRMLLSVPFMEGSRNTSLFPKKREGDLRKSLYYRSAKVMRKKTPKSILFRVQVNWDVNPKKTFNGVDYGELLNSGDRFKGSTFFGWKDRTYTLLERRVKQAIK